MGSRGQRAPSRQGKLLWEFVKNFDFFACNLDAIAEGPVDTHQGPTGSSAIDYILVPETIRDRLVSCMVSDNHPLNASDHESVQVAIKLDTIRPYVTKTKRRRVKQWSKVAKDELARTYTATVEDRLASLVGLIQHAGFNEHSIDPMFERVIRILIDSAEAIPECKPRKNSKPFWNDRLKKLKMIKVEKFNQWKQAGRPRESDNPLLCAHKDAKKQFSRELRRVSKLYENEQVLRAVQASEIDRGAFWKMLKKYRDSSGSNVSAIRNKSEKVVYSVNEVLNTWREHFATLCTPKVDPQFDEEHFNMVNQAVVEWDRMEDGDQFSNTPITTKELMAAINKLHLRKASGYDDISAEHIKYGGFTLVFILSLLFNAILKYEYVPVNFRRGIQVPLYKGKNTCQLDVDNYRGITLLTNFNKIFEIVIWNRIEKWWVENGVISSLQGACKRGQSCVHTAFLLQETVAHALETNKHVFVMYYDVSKAFDTVWTNGLFYKLYEIGIRGRMWRLLYRAYKDFFCRVRIEGCVSEWYPMLTGIHQGGFLSLLKYTAFINELILSLQHSGLCCGVHDIPTCPSGYADDLATACLSKSKTDQVLNIVNNYGNRWRFHFNAKKSAVLIYGEGKKSYQLNSSNRVFKLGSERVPEKPRYDHVGVKSMIFADDDSRVKEKVMKARRALNASSGLGIKKNGLTMKTCNVIFWSIVIPILTFSSEIWTLTEGDLEVLLNFQIYAGRRIQRLPMRSPGGCCFFGLGWIRISTYILIKKLLFALTILRMDDDNCIRRMFCSRINDLKLCDKWDNPHRSAVLEIICAAKRLGLCNVLIDMVCGKITVIGKKKWSKCVWEKAWILEDIFWDSTKLIHKENDLMYNTIVHSRYMSWWRVSDKIPTQIKMCETMGRIMCHASWLKCDDVRLKGLTPSHRMCSECDMYVLENIVHLVMQCPMHENDRVIMYGALYDFDPSLIGMFSDSPEKILYWLLGREIDGKSEAYMFGFWCISGNAIFNMYRKVCASRTGVGLPGYGTAAAPWCRCDVLVRRSLLSP